MATCAPISVVGAPVLWHRLPDNVASPLRGFSQVLAQEGLIDGTPSLDLEDEIQAGEEGSAASVELSGHPLDPVAFMSLARFLAHDDGTATVALSGYHQYREYPTSIKGSPAGEDETDVFATAYSTLSAETLVHLLLVRCRHQNLTSFAATAAQHLTPALAAHAGKEPMGPALLDPARLIGPFHRSTS